MNIDQIKSQLQARFFGETRLVEQFLAAVISENHVLIEDIPGVGKTTLARSCAELFQVDFQRVQGTPDLLPADILGTTLFNPLKGQFETRRGPIFTHMLFFDELNRANPRTQSALLQSMAERQVTIDRETFPLSDFFVVIATQNPLHFEGTFPLPESQLDRFAIRLHLDYPTIENEMRILRTAVDPPPAPLTPAPRSQLLAWRGETEKIHVSDKILGYIAALTRASRRHPRLRLGASPRAGLSLLRLARGLARVRGRDFATPDDIQELLAPVFTHRIMGDNIPEILDSILKTTEVAF